MYKCFDQLTYSRPLTFTQNIEWHLMNLDPKMLFLRRIFSYNFKDEIFIYSFFESSVIYLTLQEDVLVGIYV